MRAPRLKSLLCSPVSVALAILRWKHYNVNLS